MSQQTIFRTTLTKEFTIYPNKLIRDKRLTFKARGLLFMVLSNEKEWVVTCGWLEAQTTEGRDAIRTALDELKAFGYATFKREVDPETKRFDRCVWNFYDTPGHWLEGKKPKVGFPKDGKPSEGNPPDGSPPDGKASDKEEPAAENNQKKNVAALLLPPEAVFWNANCKDLPKVAAWSDKRQKFLSLRRKDKFWTDNYQVAILLATKSVFLTGGNDRGWKADFSWLIERPDAVLGIIEGKYGSKGGGQANGVHKPVRLGGCNL